MEHRDLNVRLSMDAMGVPIFNENLGTSRRAAAARAFHESEVETQRENQEMVMFRFASVPSQQTVRQRAKYTKKWYGACGKKTGIDNQNYRNT